jgi:hypothetical protein
MALARAMLPVIIGIIFLLTLALPESGMAAPAPMLTLRGSTYYFYYEFKKNKASLKFCRQTGRKARLQAIDQQ